MKTDVEEYRKDIEKIKGLFNIGVLTCPALLKDLEKLDKGESQDVPAIKPYDFEDRVLKYETAAKVLDVSKSQIKKLVYAGKLKRAIDPDGERALGVFASSVKAYQTTLGKKPAA